MLLTRTTPVPNSLFDVFLKDLSLVEIKVLLIIIRQTLGWKDKRGMFGRKEMDWISTSQLISKTGCSRRGITQATNLLVRKGLISVFDEQRNILLTSSHRQGKTRLYYTPLFAVDETVNKPLNTESACANSSQDIRKEITALVQKMRITKETL